MQLTGPEIQSRMQISNPKNPNQHPDIVIEPFFENCLGSNSYDLHLAPVLKVYSCTVPHGMKIAIPFDSSKEMEDYSMRDWFESEEAYTIYTKNPLAFDPSHPKYFLNPSKKKETVEFKIPETGAILHPRFGYLGSTIEYTETFNLFPYIDGKSSTGRNFMSIHQTAGRGDDGFCGNWTLEILVHCPTIVYPGMRIGQIYYEQFVGNRKPYNENPASHYNNQKSATSAAPVPIDAQILQYLKQQKML